MNGLLATSLFHAFLASTSKTCVPAACHGGNHVAEAGGVEHIGHGFGAL